MYLGFAALGSILLLAFFEHLGLEHSKRDLWLQLRSWWRKYYLAVIVYGIAAVACFVIMRWVFEFLALGKILGGL